MPKVKASIYFDKNRNRTIRKPTGAGKEWYYDTKEGRRYKSEKGYRNQRAQNVSGGARNEYQRLKKRKNLRAKGKRPRSGQSVTRRRIASTRQYLVDDSGTSTRAIAFIRRYPNRQGYVQYFVEGEQGNVEGSPGLGPQGTSQADASGFWVSLPADNLGERIPDILAIEAEYGVVFWRVLAAR